MKVGAGVSRVLLLQSAGFALAALLSVCNHVLWRPFAGATPLFPSGFIELAVVLVVWGLVFLATRRLLRRVQHLEGMLRVCAWCRKIGGGGKWKKLEEYFADDFHMSTTHGICPDCLKKLEEDTKQFCREECRDCEAGRKAA